MENFNAQTRLSSHPSTIAVLVAATIILIAIFSAPTLRADTQTAPQATLTVFSASTTGQPLTGYYTIVSQNGAQTGSGFSPMSFSVSMGQTYTVTMENYGSCRFAYFVGGGANPLTVTVTSDTEELAIYNCLTTNVTIQSVDQFGNALPGYFVSIWQSGSLAGASYTPISFNIFTNQAYTVQASNFGACTFSNWQATGSTDTTASFIASGQGQTFVAVYNCA